MKSARQLFAMTAIGGIIFFSACIINLINNNKNINKSGSINQESIAQSDNTLYIKGQCKSAIRRAVNSFCISFVLKYNNEQRADTWMSIGKDAAAYVGQYCGPQWKVKSYDMGYTAALSVVQSNSGRRCEDMLDVATSYIR